MWVFRLGEICYDWGMKQIKDHIVFGVGLLLVVGVGLMGVGVASGDAWGRSMDGDLGIDGDLGVAGEKGERRPNIVLVMIDDLGWMDLNVQGNKRLDTPRINQFAGEGMRFTDAYAAAPVCSPTRASILTGQSPARLHMTNHLPGGMVADKSKLLPPKIVKYLALEKETIAEHLKKAGYATGFFGKWHVASEGDKAKGLKKEDYFPLAQGFDVNYGGCHYGGPPTFFDPYRIPTLENRKAGEYLPDRLADEAMAYIDKHKDGPFLVFMWNYTVHWPMEGKAHLVKKYESRVGPGIKDARYAAMIESMDEAFGRLVDHIDKLGLGKDTLIVFTSDNGGFAGVADNRPLRAAKGHLYEGGIRVPFIARWTGKIEGGVVSGEPVISTDLFPTFMGAAGVKLPGGVPMDGESLLPVFFGERKLERDAIYFHYPNFAWHKGNRLGGAIRSGDYKLIERFDNGELELFDLRKDLSETVNLAKRLPKVAKAMQAKLAGWRKANGAQMPRKRE